MSIKFELTGFILAGGKSRRFGSNKAYAELDGKTNLGIAIDLLDSLDLPFYISGDPKDYPDLKHDFVEDLLPERGPLGALHSAFSALDAECILVLTCDMPLMTKEVLKTLLTQYQSSSSACIFAGDKDQPFPGIYSRKLSHQIEDALTSQKLSMRSLLDQAENVQRIPFEHSKEAFFNINTVDDLEKLKNDLN